MANILPKTTGAMFSAEFTVATSAHIHCFPNDGSRHVGKVQIKNSDGSFSDFKAAESPGKAATVVTLDQINSSRLIIGQGTYIFKKEDTGAIPNGRPAVEIGIDVEG